jgi:hypothetical protein
VYDDNDRISLVIRELVPGGVPSGADLLTLARDQAPDPPYVIEETVLDSMGQVRTRIDGRGVRTSFAHETTVTTYQREAVVVGYTTLRRYARTMRPRCVSRRELFCDRVTMAGTIKRESRLPSNDQGVSRPEPGEAAEVAIGRPELIDSVIDAECGDAGVVHQGPRDEARLDLRPEGHPVLLGLGEQHEARSLQPRVDLRERIRERRRRCVAARVGDDAEELVNARPGYRPGRDPFGELRDAAAGRLEPGRVLPVRVDEDVGVDRDHEPRPS